MSSALPHKYIPSIAQPDRSPPRARKRRDSTSPERREYETQGGGYGSRRRSPGASGRVARRDDRDDRDRGDGRDGRDDRGKGRERHGEAGGGGRAAVDNGYEGRKRKVEEGYGEAEREKERGMEKKRYEEGVVDKPAEAPKPNFGTSGLLAKETNTVKGVQLKYNEPPEARKPLKNWRLYVFKGKEQIDLVHIYRQSCYLVGRDEVVTDIPIGHPSCSKQHAVIQYRQITEKNEYGDASTSIKPFVIDLDSTNGTYVNDQEIPKSRYYELRNTDGEPYFKRLYYEPAHKAVIKFGTSSREYVLLHEDASA